MQNSLLCHKGLNGIDKKVGINNNLSPLPGRAGVSSEINKVQIYYLWHKLMTYISRMAYVFKIDIDMTRHTYTSSGVE